MSHIQSFFIFLYQLIHLNSHRKFIHLQKEFIKPNSTNTSNSYTKEISILLNSHELNIFFPTLNKIQDFIFNKINTIFKKFYNIFFIGVLPTKHKTNRTIVFPRLQDKRFQHITMNEMLKIKKLRFCYGQRT